MIGIPLQCCPVWRCGFAVCSQANPEENCLVVIGNTFRGKRREMGGNVALAKNMKNGPGGHLKDGGTEGGNVVIVKDMKNGRGGHFEDVSPPPCGLW